MFYLIFLHHHMYTKVVSPKVHSVAVVCLLLTSNTRRHHLAHQYTSNVPAAACVCLLISPSCPRPPAQTKRSHKHKQSRQGRQSSEAKIRVPVQPSARRCKRQSIAGTISDKKRRGCNGRCCLTQDGGRCSLHQGSRRKCRGWRRRWWDGSSCSDGRVRRRGETVRRHDHRVRWRRRRCDNQVRCGRGVCRDDERGCGHNRGGLLGGSVDGHRRWRDMYLGQRRRSWNMSWRGVRWWRNVN